MDYDLKELINEYVNSCFTDEKQDVIEKAFLLFDAFEHHRAYEPFPDILLGYDGADVTIDNDERIEMFLSAVMSGLTYILSEHQVELSSLATMEETVSYCIGLLRIQSYEDPVVLSRVFEAQLSDLEAFAKIMNIVNGDMTEAEYLMVLERVSPTTIQTVKEFLAKREQLIEEENNPGPETLKFVQGIRDFFQVFGKENLPYELIEAGMTVGHPFETYLPFIDQYLVDQKDPRKTAINFMGVFLMSVDTYDNLLIAFNTYSELITPPDYILKVGQAFSELTLQYTKFMKEKNEKAQLSASQH